MSATIEPTFATVPDGDESSGRDALDLAAAYGIPLDPWQKDIVKGILRESNGQWSASQAGLVVSRQSGKGQIILALELAGLLLFNESILHTAHIVKTASDAFRKLWNVFESHDDLSRLVKRQSMQSGQEFLELTNGSRIAFATRSQSTGRGLSIDRLVVDEAQNLPAAEVGALAPTVFARPRAQSLYFGTAPGPMNDSEAFETMRKAAHDGLNPRLAWFEWSAEFGQDVDDQELWVRVNPAVSTGRVPLQAIMDDRAVLPPDQFRSERLSMWLPSAAERDAVFSEETWLELADPTSVISGEVAIGLDCPPSRDYATVSIAGRRADGQMHLEFYHSQEGVQWLPQWIGERLGKGVRSVVIDDRSPLAELRWSGAGVRPTLAGTKEVASAAGQLSDSINEGQLRHRAQVELSRGVLNAQRRSMLGGAAFAWERRAPGSSELIAASLAVWGLNSEQVRKPRRRTPGESQRRAVVM